jgi:recombination protein RecT
MADTTRVRNQLATTRQATPATTGGNGTGAPPTTAQLVRQAIDRQAGAFQAVLPSTVDPTRFSRLVLTAIKATPELMRCFSSPQGETSVLLAAMQAAAIGLEPNTALQECWLLPRQIKGTWECQLSIGYRGYLKLARRSGTLSTCFAEVVHEHDEFHWSRGLVSDEFVHVPADGDRGRLTHAYAIARFRDGGYSFVVLSETDIEKRRNMSDSWKSDRARPYSPWTKWTEAMWRKSAIRALLPYLDLSVEATTAVESDERQFVFNRDEGALDDLETSTDLELEAGSPEPTTEDGQAVDAETGEVQG